MSPTNMQELSPTEAAQLIKAEAQSFSRTSPLNRMPASDNDYIFDEPLVQFADGDDPIFTEYKTIIDPTHLTPHEALGKTFNKSPEDLSESLSLISWILPITGKTRKSNRQHKSAPSILWGKTRHYGEQFSAALREHVVKLLTEAGYLAAAPTLQPYFGVTYQTEGTGYFSNWSERHIAYAAGLGTFSLSDGFISERGIAHRCGSVVTSLALPASPRTANTPYANCLFYANNSCNACIKRCPTGAISEQGHDKMKCREYINVELGHLKKAWDVANTGCGLCQVKVPCEFRNPMQKLKKVDAPAA